MPDKLSHPPPTSAGRRRFLKAAPALASAPLLMNTKLASAASGSDLPGDTLKHDLPWSVGYAKYPQWQQAAKVEDASQLGKGDNSLNSNGVWLTIQGVEGVKAEDWSNLKIDVTHHARYEGGVSEQLVWQLDTHEVENRSSASRLFVPTDMANGLAISIHVRNQDRRDGLLDRLMLGTPTPADNKQELSTSLRLRNAGNGSGYGLYEGIYFVALPLPGTDTPAQPWLAQQCNDLLACSVPSTDTPNHFALNDALFPHLIVSVERG